MPSFPGHPVLPPKRSRLPEEKTKAASTRAEKMQAPCDEEISFELVNIIPRLLVLFLKQEIGLVLHQKKNLATRTYLLSVIISFIKSKQMKGACL